MSRLLKRLWNVLDDRLGLSQTIGPMAKHLVPHDAGWWYVFGSATLSAFMLQVVTGAALAFSYIPSSSEAYSTIRFISTDASFGHFLRGLHYYGASAMVLMVGAHASRVFLFGSYKYPREMNWMTGVLLLGFTILMGFTGQLLRWDQTAVWSVVVGAEQAGRVPLIGHWLAHFMLGGTTIGGATLSRFFAIHVFVVPACLFAFIGLHMALVLRHGVSEPPKPGHPVVPATYKRDYEAMLKKSGHPFWPYAAWRDVTFSVLMLAVIAILALTFGPPHLGKPPDPSIIDADPRPDWYLLWYFAILALQPHGMENYFMVLAPLVGGLVLFGLPLFSNRGERSPRRRPWAVAIMALIVASIGALWWAGVKSDWSPNFKAQPLPPEVVGATSGSVYEGSRLFYSKACLNCHLINQFGGRRGPDLTYVADRLTRNDMIERVMNGGVNMPAFAHNMTSTELSDLIAFLESRSVRNPSLPRSTHIGSDYKVNLSSAAARP